MVPTVLFEYSTLLSDVNDYLIFRAGMFVFAGWRLAEELTPLLEEFITEVFVTEGTFKDGLRYRRAIRQERKRRRDQLERRMRS